MMYIRFLCETGAGKLASWTLQWRHNGNGNVSNHQPHDCLFSRLFRRRSKKTSKLRVTGLCAGNSPGTGEIPAQMASNAENVSIWWRHHEDQFYWGLRWFKVEQVFLSHLTLISCHTFMVPLLDGLTTFDLEQIWHQIYTRFPGTLFCSPVLTHWGLMMHICVGKLTTIGSDNGLSARRRQAIIWTNAGILFIRPLGANFRNFDRNSYIFIHENAFENVWWTATILSRLQCFNSLWPTDAIWHQAFWSALFR